MQYLENSLGRNFLQLKNKNLMEEITKKKLLFTLHKEPVIVSDFDLLHLKNYFKFLKSVKATCSLTKS